MFSVTLSGHLFTHPEYGATRKTQNARRFPISPVLSALPLVKAGLNITTFLPSGDRERPC